MMYAECTRTALVFLSHASTILMGFRLFGHFEGKIYENFSDVGLAHCYEDGQKHYAGKFGEFPLKVF